MSIFSNSDTTNQENNPSNAGAGAVDAIVNKLMEIKRPDGTPKYTDPIVALEALQASQEHIQRLETENAAFKKEAEKVATLEDTIKRLSGPPNVEKLNPQTGGEGGRSVEAAEEIVARLLDQKLQEREAVSTAISNVKKVNDALINKFGTEDKAAEVIKAKAKALNTTPDALEKLSAQNPTLVLELFGSSANAAPSPVTGSIMAGGIQKPADLEVKAPEVSILSGLGATSDKQMEFFRQIKQNVNKRLGVQE